MLSAHAAQREWIAGIRKMLDESKEIVREMIGRMSDEEVVELAELCLDEMELREYSVLRLCVNKEKVDSPYVLGIAGSMGNIASSLVYLGVKSEQFVKCLKVVVEWLETKKEEFAELIGNDEEAE